MAKSYRASKFGALIFWVLLAAGCFGPEREPDEGIYQVSHVVDGDTVRLVGGGKVRLIGINSPELNRDNGGEEPLARQARVVLERLIGGRPVRLVYGSERLDRHGRQLAHLETSAGVNVQQELLRQGLSAAVVFPPNLGNREQYRRAENEARSAGRGIWGHPYYRPREAATLNAQAEGFRFVTGEIARISHSRRYLMFWLSERFAILIAHADWKAFWTGRPADFVGRRVFARGWLFQVDGGSRMRIRHPDMLHNAT